MTHAFDALVVGAGPAGCAVAIVLARAGWSVALFEKEPYPRRKVCGECIAASNLPLLEALGVGDAVMAAAGPAIVEAALYRGEACVRAPLPPAADPRFRWGRALGRDTLDTLLLAAAARAGVRVFQPCRVDRWQPHEGGWRCIVRDADAPFDAPVLIDAHGSWDAPRPVADARAATDLFAFKANFDGATVAPGLLPVLCFDGGYGGLVLADRGRATIACCVRRDRLAQWRAAERGAPAGEAVEAMLRRQCAGVRQVLGAAERVGPWLAVGPIAPGIRLRADETFFRVGNAAGEAHPILGEGISMALQSGVLLGEQLAARPPQGGAVAAWQADAARRYARAWRRAFVVRHRVAALFAHAAMRPLSSAALVGLVRRLPAVMTGGARLGGKVTSAVTPRALARDREPAGL